ncbi:hypothetical protein V2S66_18405 [Streptomyces sp. V4-01]|uniref:DUF8129 domain-containing protein n=1 Tax=Actinacidiphila polyblastidii TaxID=3110430 RepID=A0ABU7PDP8_9ACTN|nr:hypothetical protein [Streptomyces sp. V4-01]
MRDDRRTGPVPEAGELPIDGYDHATVRSVGDRARSLTSVELEDLVRYEAAHQGRTQVIRLLVEQLRRQREETAEARSRPGGYGPAPTASRPGAH